MVFMGAGNQLLHTVAAMYVSCALLVLIGASAATTEFSSNQIKILDTMDTRLGVVERQLQQMKANASCTSGEQTQQLKQIAAQLKAVNDLLEQRLLQPAGKTDDGPVNVTFPNGSYPRDCSDIFTLGIHSNGVYLIQPKNSPEPIPVLCEMSHAGWTVIMNRFDGSVDFYRRWSEYKEGFGSPDGEYYLGNEKIFWLTNQKRYRLRVELTFKSNKTQYYADYYRFTLGDEASKYMIKIAEFRGNAFDRMRSLNGRRFTTWDNDNDAHSGNCATHGYKAGWWFSNCFTGHEACLFGSYGLYMSWKCGYSDGYLKKTTMKLLPI